MQDLKKMEKTELVDLLAKEAARFYKMNRADGERKAYDECKKTIEKIQFEISHRAKQKHKS